MRTFSRLSPKETFDKVSYGWRFVKDHEWLDNTIWHFQAK